MAVEDRARLASGGAAGERTGTVGNEQEPRTDAAGRRRFPAARVRRPEPETRAEPGFGDEAGQEFGADLGAPEPVSRSPFAPRSFAGGRVQVFGCSPAWLLISLVASIVLTLVLNLVLGVFS